MGFDAKKFLQTQFIPREENVPVPDMKDFFPEGAKPEWKVRGLTGIEVAYANEAAERNENIAEWLQGILSKNTQEKIDAVKELVGVGEKIPGEVAKCVEYLIVGSLCPIVDIEMALKICKVFPIEFKQIAMRIIKLTGQGHVPGKPKPSGEIQKSK